MIPPRSKKVTIMKAPFKGHFKITSLRGYRYIFGNVEYHGGIDLVGLDDATVYAIADGTIDAVLYEAKGFGYYVRQLLPDGRRVYYGHLAKGSIIVRAGQKIKAGDKLGTMGATGRVTGAHLHLELRPAGTTKNSLDISEFTGIPNKLGEYEAKAKTVLEEDLNVLVSNGIINSPDYWLDKAPKWQYLPELIHNVAEYFR